MFVDARDFLISAHTLVITYRHVFQIVAKSQFRHYINCYKILFSF